MNLGIGSVINIEESTEDYLIVDNIEESYLVVEIPYGIKYPQSRKIIGKNEIKNIKQSGSIFTKSEKVLPIGTWIKVIIKEQEFEAMIVTYEFERNNQIYKYGVITKEGYVAKDKIVPINEDIIVKVIKKGSENNG